MKRLTVLAIVVGLLTVAVPAHSAAKPTLKLTMSNFRYCKAPSCTPFDVGYARSSNGPVADNPRAVIEVRQGYYVQWVYRDASCDDFGCTGHNVYFETGKPTGKRIGFAPSNKGPRAITTLITQKKGTTIRYFCTVSNHYQTGMTGILKVV